MCGVQNGVAGAGGQFFQYSETSLWYHFTIFFENRHVLVLSGHDVGRLNRCSMYTHEAHENHLNRLHLAYNWANLSDFQFIVDNTANVTMGCKQLIGYVYTINNRT